MKVRLKIDNWAEAIQVKFPMDIIPLHKGGVRDEEHFWKVNTGDWLVFQSDGNLAVVPDGQFRDKYERILEVKV